MAVTGMAGEDEEDRGLQTLRSLPEEMSLRIKYTGAAGEKL